MDIKFSAFSVTLSILVSVIIIQSNGQSFVSLTTVGDILSVTKESVKLIAKGWKVLDRNFNVEEIPIPLLDRAEEKIISRLKIINRKLDALQDHLTAEGNYFIFSNQNKYSLNSSHATTDTIKYILQLLIIIKYLFIYFFPRYAGTG